MATALPADSRLSSTGCQSYSESISRWLAIHSGSGRTDVPFGNAGVMPILPAMRSGRLDDRLRPVFAGRHQTLADIVEPAADIDPEFFVRPEDIEKWRFLKGAKSSGGSAERRARVHLRRGSIPSPTRSTDPPEPSSLVKAARPLRGSSTSSLSVTGDIGV